MTTAIAIFVKTPGVSPLKTRLAATIGTEKAHDFYHLSLAAIEQTVTSADIDAFWAVGEEASLTHPLWSSFETIYTQEGDLGDRQHHIYDFLLRKYERVLLIGADTPQISRDIIAKAISILETKDYVIGPATDGGYYLFGGRRPLPLEKWKNVPWSVETTRQILQEQLPAPAPELQALTDVDIYQDLQNVMTEMPKDHHAKQAAILQWITDQTGASI